LDYFSIAMLHAKHPKQAPGPLIALAAVLSVSFAASVSAETIREYDSPTALVRLTLLPAISATEVPEDSLPVPESQGTPLDSIADFTALSQVLGDVDALMEVQYLDRGSSEEFRFPLKYSEARRHLLQNPARYAQPDLQERNAALFGDLARSLQVQMHDPVEMGGKP
jgi:hypothetical protein